MDFSLKDDILMCGYEKGHLVLWSLVKKNEHLRTINPPDSNPSPIFCIKFWKEGTNNAIVSNGKGVVYLYEFSYKFFQWAADKKMLLNHEEDKKKGIKDKMGEFPTGFFNIQLLKKEHTKGHALSKYTLIALASMKMVLVVSLDPSPNIIYKYERPNDINELSISCISWGRGSLMGKICFPIFN